MHDKIAVLLSVVLTVIVVAIAISLVVSARTSDDVSLADDPFDPVAALTEYADPTYQALSASNFATLEADLTANPRPTETPSASDLAELDDSPGLPGRFVASQGSGHYDGRVFEVLPLPYCEGVPWSGIDDPVTLNTPVPLTPISPGGPSAYYRGPMSDGRDCYTSNPPSSGRHAGAEQNVDFGGGLIAHAPPVPGVYPDEVYFPRAVLPHILEHAGVFVGYHCVDADVACEEIVQRLADVVTQRIDAFADRVVMARDTDLPVGEIGLAAWTRVLNFAY